MRLLVTADLHVNHARSGPLALDLIDRMNAAGGDGVLLVGDTAAADGPELEQALARFTTPGPKLFLCGNHELWTRGPDSHRLFTHDLPARVRALGWHWLEGAPYVARSFAVVGTVGWYDYAFASPRLAIPDRFYEAKIAPGCAEYFGRGDLLATPCDLNDHARDMVARWNDGKFVKLHRTDHAFLAERVASLDAGLASVAHLPQVIAATHHLPFRDLLPPPRFHQIEFAKAYLGSPKLGDALLRHPNVSHVYCGHSHFPATATVGHVHAINVGSSYRYKSFETLDLPD